MPACPDRVRGAARGLGLRGRARRRLRVPQGRRLGPLPDQPGRRHARPRPAGRSPAARSCSRLSLPTGSAPVVPRRHVPDRRHERDAAGACCPARAASAWPSWLAVGVGWAWRARRARPARLVARGDRAGHPDPGQRRTRASSRRGPARRPARGTSAVRRRTGSGSSAAASGCSTPAVRPGGSSAGARWPPLARGGLAVRPARVWPRSRRTPSAIEETQLHLARIDRACDVTDIIDNVTGAVSGPGRPPWLWRSAPCGRSPGVALSRSGRALGLRDMTSSAAARPTSPQIPAYVAGKPPGAARPGLTTYKLSSNENPYPPLPGVVEAARGRGRSDEPLPRHGQHRALRGAGGQARRAGRPPGRRHRLGGADLPAPAGVLRARRRGRLRLALLRGLPDRGHGGRRPSVQVPVTADGRHDLDAMAAAITDRTRSCMVCTPNNPTGPAVTQTELDEFLAAGARTCSWSSTRPTSSSCGWTTPSTASRPPRATPTSCCSARSPRPTAWPASGSGTPSPHAPIAAALRAVSLPFGVSSVAQAAAIASLARRGRAARAGRRPGRRARPRREPGSRRRLGVPEPQGNFVWFPPASAPPTSPPPPTTPASWSARSPATAPGSRSASPRPTTG